MKARRRNCVVAKLEGTWCRPSEHIRCSSSLSPTRLAFYLTITQSSDHNKNSGRNILINMVLLGRKIWLISGGPTERLFPFTEREIFPTGAPGPLVTGGRAGSHRTSGLSMPQTPTTERSPTWDLGLWCCGDVVTTSLMTDVP